MQSYCIFSFFIICLIYLIFSKYIKSEIKKLELKKENKKLELANQEKKNILKTMNKILELYPKV